MKKLVFAALLALNAGAVLANGIADEAPEAPKPREIEAPQEDVAEAHADVDAAE